MHRDFKNTGIITTETIGELYSSSSQPKFIQASEGIPAINRLFGNPAPDRVTQEQILRCWLRNLVAFRKDILRATLSTFDICLTAVSFAPRSAAVSADVVQLPSRTVAPVMLFESAAASETSPDAVRLFMQCGQPFLAVAAADCNTLRTLCATVDTQPVLLPFTLELLECELGST